VCSGDHPRPLNCDKGAALGDPRVNDELAGIALQLAQDRVDRHRDVRHDGGDVRIDQARDLLAVGTGQTDERR